MSSSTIQFAAAIRTCAVQMVHRVNAAHIGGGMSMADLLAVLYSGTLRVDPAQPKDPKRDRFILSKGHACAALYAALALKRFIPMAALAQFGQNGSALMAHISHKVPGVEFSTGSLGHGLGFGCGKALAARRLAQGWRVFVMLSDGELDEGSNWEAILFAAHHRLDNLIAIVDYNKIQSLGTVKEVLDLDPLADKFRAFRWSVEEVDGHDHEQIQAALDSIPFEPGKPSCLIAHTVKGKGVDYMENELAWHYRSPNQELLQKALTQLGRTI